MPNGVPEKGLPPEGLPVGGEAPLEPQSKPEKLEKYPKEPSFAKTGEEGKVLEYPLITEKPKVSRLLVILGMAVLAGIIIAFGIYITRKPEEIVPTEATFEVPTITFLEEDRDKDGLSVLEEMKAGTNPENPDTDTDGMLDSWEVKYNLNPLDASDAMTDADEDGLANLEEHIYKSDPLNPDTDGDGYTDGDEVERGYNPAGVGKLPKKTSQEEIKSEIEGENIILIGAEGFDPSSLTISKGATVVWINQDTEARQVMGGILDSGVLKPGHSWQHTFKEEGTYNYFDAFDIDMRGEVVVEK